jgi:phytoene dehydrogenase-like protein
MRAGANVSRVLVRDEAVAGVVLHGGEEITSPIVLSTADPTRTLLGLVDPVWLDPDFLHAVRTIKYRGSTAVVHYALDRLPELAGISDAPSALAGVVSLTSSMDALERAYDAAKYGMMSAEPHIEITVPSLRWPSLAPNGKHVLTATVRYAPYKLRDEGTWDSARACTMADTVTAAITRAIPGFAGSVRAHTVLTPRDIEARFGATEGALTHGELTLDQILFMRPVSGWGRHAMPIDGLYLGDAGTHPGPGIVGGSGLLAAKRVLADRKK